MMRASLYVILVLAALAPSAAYARQTVTTRLTLTPGQLTAGLRGLGVFRRTETG